MPGRFRRSAAALLAVGLLSACGADSVEPRLPAADLPVGGSLVVGIGPVGSIDPHNAYEPFGTLVSSTLCDPLIGVDPVTGTLVPGLAESWQVTDEGWQFSVKLRSDARFSDGTPVKATDVVASLSRVASAEFAGSAADLLAPVAGFAAIRGQDPDAPQRHRERLAGVQALTDETIQITLADGPNADFINVLTHPVSSPMPASLLDGDPAALERQPVCAGPYRLAAPVASDATEIRLERTPDYGRYNDSYTGGGAGYADAIVFRLLPELAPADPAAGDDAGGGEAARPATAPARSRLRDVDVVALEGSLHDAGGAFDVVAAAGPGIEYVGLPFSGPAASNALDSVDPLEAAALGLTPSPDDPRTGAAPVDAGGRDAEADDARSDAGGDAALRHALSLALDRRRIARRIFDGRRSPAIGFLPATLGTAWARGTRCGGALPPRADVEAARAVLAEAGVSLEGQELTFTYNPDYENEAMVREIARQWSAAFGVNVSFKPLAWEDYLTVASGTETFQGPFRFSWSSPYPSPDRYLHPLFHGGQVGRTNFAGYIDARFDDVIDRQARTATVTDDRRLLYQQLEDHVCETLPLIPVVAEQRRWALRPDIVSATELRAGGPRGEPLLRELSVSR